MKKYQIEVPSNLWAWVKYQAEIEGKTINQFIVALIERAKGK